MRHHHLYATNGNVPKLTTTTDNRATIDAAGGLGTTTATTNKTTAGASSHTATYDGGVSCQALHECLEP
jgi:hypothetical protein